MKYFWPKVVEMELFFWPGSFVFMSMFKLVVFISLLKVMPVAEIELMPEVFKLFENVFFDKTSVF
jgi:hypothetical protein